MHLLALDSLTSQRSWSKLYSGHIGLRYQQFYASLQPEHILFQAVSRLPIESDLVSRLTASHFSSLARIVGQCYMEITALECWIIPYRT